MSKHIVCNPSRLKFNEGVEVFEKKISHWVSKIAFYEFCIITCDTSHQPELLVYGSCANQYIKPFFLDYNCLLFHIQCRGFTKFDIHCPKKGDQHVFIISSRALLMKFCA